MNRTNWRTWISQIVLALVVVLLFLSVAPASSQTNREIDEAFRERDYRTLLLYAEQGSAEAQYNLGRLYRSDETIPNHLATAAKWFTAAAQSGHAHAQYELSTAYRMGDGVQQSNAEAARWHLAAARQGHARAQKMLGYHYLKGEAGFTQDLSESFRWFSEASKGNDLFAAFEAGIALYEGRGVGQNYHIAAEHFERAARCGHPKAQHYIGNAYSVGLGVKKDITLAYMWLNLAASQGFETSTADAASVQRDALEKTMLPEQISEAQRMSREWKPPAQCRG